MSAPSPAPVAPPALAAPLGRLIVLRLLGVGACVAVGFVAIWQGFGAAGYGTDAHRHRVMWACFQLLGFGVPLVCVKGWFPVRVFVALAFFASAGRAWWTVRSSDDGPSLREAVGRRDELRSALATPGAADPWNTLGVALHYQTLQAHYPSLLDPLRADYARWAEDGIAALRKRYQQTAPDDIKGVITLREYAVGLDEASPGTFALFMTEEREWLDRAVEAHAAELSGVMKGRDDFKRTAPARKALADAFPEARPRLLAAEEDWVGDPATRIFVLRVYIEPGDRTDWKAMETNILSLPALDTSDGRFKVARKSLFEAAHEDARSDVTAHLDAKRYDRAFGVARKHAVEWNATATVLGEDYVKQLDELRTRCEALAKMHENDPAPAEPVEVAPPPRTKPEK